MCFALGGNRPVGLGPVVCRTARRTASRIMFRCDPNGRGKPSYGRGSGIVRSPSIKAGGGHCKLLRCGPVTWSNCIISAAMRLSGSSSPRPSDSGWIALAPVSCAVPRPVFRNVGSSMPSRSLSTHEYGEPTPGMEWEDSWSGARRGREPMRSTSGGPAMTLRGTATSVAVQQSPRRSRLTSNQSPPASWRPCP